MTTSNAAAVDKTTAKTGTEKGSEKLAEKRRALGRGLESLLPGPRVLPPSPTLPLSTRKDGAPASSGPLDGTAIPGTVDEIQAAAQMSEGEQTLQLDLDQIEQNPYQTRTEFDPKALGDLAGSIQAQGVLQPIVV